MTRFVRPVEPAQRDGAVGQELRIVRRDCQRPVIGGKRLRGTIELEQRIAAIAERIEMIGIGGEDALEVLERVARASQLQQRHAAPVEKLGVVRREAKARVIAGKRLPSIAAENENKTQAGKSIGALTIALQRRLNQHQRRVVAPALIMELA